MYYKQRQYTGFYNAGLTICFLSVQAEQYILADKVYSLFG